MKKNKSEYSSLNEWRMADPHAYNSAYYQGFIEKICKHFGWETKETKPRGYWSKGQCIEEALKYKTRSSWKKSNKGSYNSAQRNKWFDECRKHMK